MKQQNRFAMWYLHDKGLSSQEEIIWMMLDLDKEEE
jgi:hypothetical protein